MSTEQLTGLQMAVKLLAQIGDDNSDAAIAAVHAVMDPGQLGELPEGLSIAVEMIGEYVESVRLANRNPVTGNLSPHAEIDQRHSVIAIDAIRAEHHQRLTLQHHATDLAQRVADLESIVNAPRGTDTQVMKEREISAAAIDGALAFGYQGTDAPEAGHWLLSAHNAGKRIAELEADISAVRAHVIGDESVIPRIDTAQSVPTVVVTTQPAGCNRGNRCPWSDGEPSYCKHCGMRAQGSGQ